MPEHLLAGQVAIITGAGRGIGQATAVAFANEGASVVLAAQSELEINRVANQIKATGGKVLAVPTDVSDIAQVDHLLVLALRAFNRVDILVNNAVIVHPLGKVWESSPRAWSKVIAVNVIGPYLCARAILPHMLDRGSGRIINVSSAAAEIDLPGGSAYAISKAALERFSSTLALELKSSGVIVSTLRPGLSDQDMQDEIRQPSQHRLSRVADWQARHIEGELEPAKAPARDILWLASHFASDANGQLFNSNDPAFRQRVERSLP